MNRFNHGKGVIQNNMRKNWENWLSKNAPPRQLCKIRNIIRMENPPMQREMTSKYGVSLGTADRKLLPKFWRLSSGKSVIFFVLVKSRFWKEAPVHCIYTAIWTAENGKQLSSLMRQCSRVEVTVGGEFAMFVVTRDTFRNWSPWNVMRSHLNSW